MNSKQGLFLRANCKTGGPSRDVSWVAGGWLSTDKSCPSLRPTVEKNISFTEIVIFEVVIPVHVFLCSQIDTNSAQKSFFYIIIGWLILGPTTSYQVQLL